MKSTATHVSDYLASLPTDRRAALEAVRKVILENLDKDYEECMVWGVAAYAIPQRVFPPGHHTDPKKPVLMAGSSSQKNDMVVYLMNVHLDPALGAWFKQAWEKTGKRLGLEVGGGGCCVRFKKLDDLALDVIGEVIRRTPVSAHLASYTRMLAARGKGPDGKKLKAGKAGPETVKTPVKKAGKLPVKKVAKKVVKKKAKR